MLTNTNNPYGGVIFAIDYFYNTNGLLDHTTDTENRTISYAYTEPNNSSQPSTITDNSLGRTISIAYGGPGGAMSSITDATADTITFSYNHPQRAGQISQIEAFDTNDNMTKSTDALGNATTATYNGANYVTQITAPAGAAGGTGGSNTFTYGTNTSIRPNSSADAETNATGYTYDTNILFVYKTTFADGSSTLRNYQGGEHELQRVGRAAVHLPGQTTAISPATPTPTLTRSPSPGPHRWG